MSLQGNLPEDIQKKLLGKQVVMETLKLDKHPFSIAVANYKGGVGKTTLTCLIGHYLARKHYNKKVLLIDIDPQCSLSLAVGMNLNDIENDKYTINQLVNPKNWTRITQIDFNSFVSPVPGYSNLKIIKGSFEVDELDIKIARATSDENKTTLEYLYLFTKQMLKAFEKQYDYILIDCPPNKMYLTKAMLQACSYYLTVTIPDKISGFGIPRLLKWINKIDPNEDKPKLLGVILNGVTKLGGHEFGTTSQQIATSHIRTSVQGLIVGQEKELLKENPILEFIPRLDKIARYLGTTDKDDIEDEFKTTNAKGLLTVEQLIYKIINKIEERVKYYAAK